MCDMARMIVIFPTLAIAREKLWSYSRFGPSLRMFGVRHKVSTVNAIDIGKHYDLVKPNVDALALEVVRPLVWNKKYL